MIKLFFQVLLVSAIFACSKEMPKRTIASFGDYVDNTKKRTFKKYLGEYKPVIGNILEYHDGAANDQLSMRYFSPDMGYFFGGSGMYVNSNEIVDFAHVYAMILIKQRQGHITTALSVAYKSKINYDEVAPLIKLREGKIVKGDIIFIPKYMQLGIKDKCVADFGDIVWLTHTDELLATGTYYPVNYFKGDRYRIPNRCKKGRKVVIIKRLLEPVPKWKGDNFNVSFLNEYMRRSKPHDIIVGDYIGSKKYLDIYKKDMIRLCSGMRGGGYHSAMATLLGRHFNKEVTDVINTNGSVENIANVNQGICDLGLVQRDVFLQKQNQLKLKNILHYMDLDYQEGMYLICLKNKRTNQLKSSLGLDGSFSLLVGAINSGTASTWENMSSVQSNFIKVRTKNLGGIKAFNALTQAAGEYDCMFNVSNDETGILRLTKNYPDQLKLIPIELDLGKAEKLGYENIKFMGIRTLSVKTDLIVNKNSIESKSIETVKVLKVLNNRDDRKELENVGIFSESTPSICTGFSGGGYEGFGVYLKDKLPYKIHVLNTEGSIFNIQELSPFDGVGCDISLFQGDTQKETVIDNSMLVMQETAALICRDNIAGKNLSTIVSKQKVKIAVGAKKSGSYFTWNELIASSPNKSNITELNITSTEAVDGLLRKRIDCLFTVGKIESDFFKQLDNPLSKVRLINIIKYPVQYRKNTIRGSIFKYTFSSNYLYTFGVPSFVTVSEKYAGTKLHDDLKKVVKEYRNVE